MEKPCRAIEDNKNGRKWEIYKKSENEYFYIYYEYFESCGWRFIVKEGDRQSGYYTKDCIESEFDIVL